ncbi:siphovirus ReqiPepy6 Gp37-like family protein [Bacillus cytotoxicus]|uniref:Siphovirus ReqiPepy6 Gp37-like family protein n=1 Tax=Bacillus cytotoxicus TaxID=580165 RepID=A0ACC6A6T3_9BACI|nr:siphovirus ReqiPepy6 Gp37-like family protein [Bacillus cytotoxicus]
MSTIFVLDKYLNFLGEVDDFQSLIFSSVWNKSASFHIRISKNSRNVELLRSGFFISIERDARKVGIINHQETTQNQEYWDIKGMHINSLMSQRLTVPPAGHGYDRITGNCENIMQHYVETNFINPSDPNRKIELLELAPSLNRGSKASWESRYKYVEDELAELAESSGLRWDLWTDFYRKKIIFQVNETVDRSAMQSNVPAVIFSPDFDNVEDQTFVNSKVNHRNFGYIAGQGEDAARRIVGIGSVSGIERKELFVDARDIENDDELPSRGAVKMAEYNPILTFETKIINGRNSNTIFNHDWFIGDIVTSQNRDWGITINNRVTEVKEIYSDNKYIIEPTFGPSIPTQFDIIRKQFKQLSSLIRK